MADKIVALTGDDATGTGSLANPYRTIKKGLQQISNGDSVLVRDIPNGGTIRYAGETFDASCAGGSLSAKYVKPYPGEQPVVRGRTQFGTSTERANYIRVVGSREILEDLSADTIIFENDQNNQHVVEPYSRGVWIEGCIVDKLDSYLGSCIAMGYNGNTGQWLAQDCKAIYNVIRGVGRDPGLGLSSAGHDHGIYLNYNLDCELAYNLILDIDGGWGIHLYTESGSARHVDGTLIHHNTIYGTRDGGVILASDGASTTQNTDADNNLCVNCGDASLTKASYSYDYFWGGPVGTGNTGTDNWSYNPADGHVRPALTGWSLATPGVGDPMFLNPGAGDYRLNPSSPALGRGCLDAGPIDATPATVGRPYSGRLGAGALGAMRLGLSDGNPRVPAGVVSAYIGGVWQPVTVNVRDAGAFEEIVPQVF